MNCPKNAKISRKRGIGILEVMVAALVLGILYAAVSNLQKCNREALLRIRGRDGATEIAQNVIDSLGALGLASFTDDMLVTDGDGNLTLAKTIEDGTRVPDTIRITRKWMGQPGLTENTMSVTYSVTVDVSQDADYAVKSGSKFLGEDCSADDSNCAVHVFAKRLNVTVSWPFKNSTQSINVSGVIR